MPDNRRNRPRPTRNRYGAEGAVWRRITAYVVGRDHGICHICLHPGANSADHDPYPVAERPDLALETSNLKAAHAYPGGCPVCSAAAVARGGKPVYCNEVKQAMSAGRARRIIETRTGLTLADESQPRGERDWLLQVPELKVEVKLPLRLELSIADAAPEFLLHAVTSRSSTGSCTWPSRTRSTRRCAAARR